MKKQMKISDICSCLKSEYYCDIKFNAGGMPEPTDEKIKGLLLVRTAQEAGRGAFAEVPDVTPICKSKKRAVKKPLRILLIAAMLCLVSVGVFAATGGLGYFESIFGGSADSVKDDISSPHISVSNGARTLAVESVLSDGYKTDIVVSLESSKNDKTAKDPIDLFSVDCGQECGSYACNSLPDFDKGKKHYYDIKLTSLKNYISETVNISVNNEEKPLKVSVPLEHSTASKTISIDTELYKGKAYKPESVELSPLGVMLIGSEGKLSENTEVTLPDIALLMKDGSKEDLDLGGMVDFGTEGSGGGVVVDDGGLFNRSTPLVTESAWNRNPGKKDVIAGYFSRIIDLDNVKAVLVDGTEYTVK